jgi:hypothetical protein
VKRLVIIAIVMLASRAVAADPALGRVIAAPTAWLPTAGGAVGTAGVDQHGYGSIDVGYGLGGIAEVDVGADSAARTCAMPPCDTDHQLATERYLARAAFRVGAHQDAWFDGQPALVFGVRTTIGDVHRVADAYVVASRTLGLASIHAGVVASDARGALAGPRLGMTVRPFTGIELTPPQYPKTTVLADLSWLPDFQPGQPIIKAAVGWGVRYQALRWGSIELDVRQRDGEWGSPTVMVRVNGVWQHGR